MPLPQHLRECAGEGMCEPHSGTHSLPLAGRKSYYSTVGRTARRVQAAWIAPGVTLSRRERAGSEPGGFSLATPALPRRKPGAHTVCAQ